MGNNFCCLPLRSGLRRLSGTDERAHHNGRGSAKQFHGMRGPGWTLLWPGLHVEATAVSTNPAGVEGMFWRVRFSPVLRNAVYPIIEKSLFRGVLLGF